MKRKYGRIIPAVLFVLVTTVALVTVLALSAAAAGSVRVDFCLTNGSLESNVFFENDSSRYFMTQNTNSDGKLTYLEELYRTDDLELEFDGWYTEGGERVTTETVFTEYTILYDRWKATSLTDEDIISELEIGTPLLEVGKTAGEYGAGSITLTDDRLSVEVVSVYEGLNAYRTNKLDAADVLEAGKSYSLRIELHTKSGELIDSALASNISASYGLVANTLYSHDTSGIFTTQWTNRENKIQVIINYDYENYYFTSELADKAVENGQSPQYTVYVTNNASISGMELFEQNALGAWESLGAVNGQFEIAAKSDVVKKYRVEVTYQNGFVIASNEFTVDWYNPDAPKFITQPTDYDVAYGTNVLVTYGLNCDVSSIKLEKYDGANWNDFQIATPTGTTVNAMESGTYTFKVHATKGVSDIYSEEFTITWREKFEFTTQPQSMTVATGEAYTVTWATNNTPSVLQVWSDDGNGNYARSFNITDPSSVSYTFDASMFAYSKNYKLMANYDSVIYFSDVFTIDIIAGEFTKQPSGEINAVVGKELLVEWEFNFNAAYYDILWYDGESFDQYDRVYQPEHAFLENSACEIQFMIEAYNENNVKIGSSELFRIIWTEQQTTYLVSFSANGGTGTMQAVEKNAGSQYKLPECAFTAPSGKIFKAWQVGSAEKQVDDEITVNANTVVSAVWKDLININEITVTGIVAPVAGAHPDVSGITVTAEGVSGFESINWSDPAHGTVVQPSATFTADKEYKLRFKLTLEEGYRLNPKPYTPGYAQITVSSDLPDSRVEFKNNYYIEIYYTVPALPVVSFDANGGTGTMDPVTDVSGEYELPECTLTPPDSAKYFKAWAIGSAEGVQNKPGETISVSSDTTLYAIWADYITIYEVNVTGIVLPEGGAHPDYSGATVTTAGISGFYSLQWCETVHNTVVSPSSTFVAGKEYKLRFKFTLEEGYRLNPRSYTTYYADITLTTNIPNVAAEAKNNMFFEILYTVPNPSTVSFDANGGTGAMASAIDKFGPYELPVCSFTAPAGKQFKAWAIGATDGAEKQPGDEIDVTDDVVIYALWKDIPHSHDYGTAWKSDANEHWKECACGDTASRAAHTDTDTNGKCDTCGSDVPVAPPVHTHTPAAEWTADANNHWHKCTGCEGQQLDKAAHADGNSDGKCDTCQYQISTVPNPDPNPNPNPDPNPTPDPTPDPNPTPDPEPEPTPEPGDDEGGLSTGAIVGIAVGSAAAVGIGGFSLLWFVIKKKSFADLIAIFKK